jgi:hypothetical protein
LEVQLDDLKDAGVCLSALEMRLPETMDLDAWCAIGRRLTRADQVMQWWLGDWAAFGLRKFEGVQEEGTSNVERRTSNLEQGKPRPRRGALKEFAESHGVNYQTLRNLAWVSSKVELSRRRDSVEWSKHAEVAALPPREQKQWLAKVEDENLPRAVLRQQIRLSQGENNALVSDGPVMESPRKYIDELNRWIAAHPDPGEPDVDGFWTPGRRAEWKEWLEAVVTFAGRL